MRGKVGVVFFVRSGRIKKRAKIILSVVQSSFACRTQRGVTLVSEVVLYFFLAIQR